MLAKSKKLRMWPSILVAAFALALISPMAAHAQLIQNGSFENPKVKNATLYHNGTYIGTTTSVDSSWLVNGQVTLLRDPQIQAYDGAQSLLLGNQIAGPKGTHAVGGITQTFGSTGAKMYDVSFYATTLPSAGPAAETGQVTFGGTARNFTVTGNGSATNPNWTKENFTFSAASGSNQTLSIASLVSANYGIVIDNIKVAAVPEVGTWLGFAVLLALGALFMRKRRTAGAIAAV
jgi:hypothetical protein